MVRDCARPPSTPHLESSTAGLASPCRRARVWCASTQTSVPLDRTSCTAVRYPCGDPVVRQRHREQIAARQRVSALHPTVQKVAQRKLAQLDAAGNINDLRVPPSNHLEKLKGDRAGQYSIRIVDQWRFCFHWTDAGPADIEFVDYH